MLGVGDQNTTARSIALPREREHGKGNGITKKHTERLLDEREKGVQGGGKTQKGEGIEKLAGGEVIRTTRVLDVSAG